VSSREDWQRRLGPLYGGAVALVHSTPWRWPTDVGEESRSAGWVVALGVPVGLVAWAVARLFLGAGFPAPLSAIVGLAMLTAASAALVERGLAEAIDRWQGQARSPGVGSLLVLVFATLVRAAAIVFVEPSHWLWLFVATAVAGRWAAVFLQALGDPVAHDPAARSLVAVPAPLWLTAAISVGVAAIIIVALGNLGIVAMGLAAVAVFALGLATQRATGGLTPAVVAAAAAIGELCVLLLATVR
jgi:cobalamin synthase